MLKLECCCVPRASLIGFRLVETPGQLQSIFSLLPVKATLAVNVYALLIKSDGPNEKDGSYEAVCSTHPNKDAAVAWLKPHIDMFELTQFGCLFMSIRNVKSAYMTSDPNRTDTFLCRVYTSAGFLSAGSFSSESDSRETFAAIQDTLCQTNGIYTGAGTKGDA